MAPYSLQADMLLTAALGTVHPSKSKIMNKLKRVGNFDGMFKHTRTSPYKEYTGKQWFIQSFVLHVLDEMKVSMKWWPIVAQVFLP